MFRALITICAVFLALPLAAAECGLRSEWRGENVQHYVPKVQDCLQNPRGEIRFDASVEAEVFDLINAERAKRGLSALVWRDELLAPARIHSFDMAQEGFFDHGGTDGRRVSDRTGALDRTLIQSEIRENIASIGGDLSYENVAGFMHTILMDSDGHRANILAPSVTHIAIGLARKEKGAWITQVFVRQEGEFASDVPLSVKLGGEPLPSAILNDWAFESIIIRDQNGIDLADLDTEVAAADNAGVFVRGSKKIDELRRSIIELRGPLMHVDLSQRPLPPEDAAE